PSKAPLPPPPSKVTELLEDHLHRFFFIVHLHCSSESYWDERFRKAISSPEELEKLFKCNGEMTNEFYEKENVGRRRATTMKDERWR
uniref:Uncharacterized protein n=1 Tax=Cucumis melo TaxID=3656 RepID=A0A9I9E9B8_CUCME